MRLLLDVLADRELVGVTLRLAEHHGAPVVPAVHRQYLSDGGRTLVVPTLDGQMLQS